MKFKLDRSHFTFTTVYLDRNKTFRMTGIEPCITLMKKIY